MAAPLSLRLVASVSVAERDTPRSGRGPSVWWRAIGGPTAPASVERQQRRADCSCPCGWALPVSVVARTTRCCSRLRRPLPGHQAPARQAARRQGRPDRHRPPAHRSRLAHAHPQPALRSGRRRSSSGRLTALLDLRYRSETLPCRLVLPPRRPYRDERCSPLSTHSRSPTDGPSNAYRRSALTGRPSGDSPPPAGHSHTQPGLPPRIPA
jgi:hypothetical protein